MSRTDRCLPNARGQHSKTLLINSERKGENGWRSSPLCCVLTFLVRACAMQGPHPECLPPSRFATLSLSALELLHDQPVSLLHRDFNPANLGPPAAICFAFAALFRCTDQAFQVLNMGHPT
eukprot:2406361-Rhodomonas_salina.1